MLRLSARNLTRQRQSNSGLSNIVLGSNGRHAEGFSSRLYCIPQIKDKGRRVIGNIIGWCVFGLIAGWIAKWLTGSAKPPGCFPTVGIGIAGSFTMGAIFHMLFASSNEGVQPAGFIGSVIGAMLVLYAYRRISGSSDKPRIE